MTHKIAEDEAIIAELEHAQEWMRVPDYAEKFSLVDMVAWANARPLTLFRRCADALRAAISARDADRAALEDAKNQMLELSRSVPYRAGSPYGYLLVDERAIKDAARGAYDVLATCLRSRAAKVREEAPFLVDHEKELDLTPQPDDDEPRLIEKEIARVIAAAKVLENFQTRAAAWGTAAFGEQMVVETSLSVKAERNHRLLEETLELVQSLGASKEEASQLVDYVYDRPAGEPKQEVGGVMVCIALLCHQNGIDMGHAAETELARIWTKIDVIRAKRAAKPEFGPLPGSAAAQKSQPSGKGHKGRRKCLPETKR